MSCYGPDRVCLRIFPRLSVHGAEEIRENLPPKFGVNGDVRDELELPGHRDPRKRTSMRRPLVIGKSTRGQESKGSERLKYRGGGSHSGRARKRDQGPVGRALRNGNHASQAAGDSSGSPFFGSSIPVAFSIIRS